MMVYSHEKNCFTSITAEVYLSSLPLDLKGRHCSGTLLVILKKIPPIVNSLRERQQRFLAPAMHSLVRQRQMKTMAYSVALILPKACILWDEAEVYWIIVFL